MNANFRTPALLALLLVALVGGCGGNVDDNEDPNGTGSKLVVPGIEVDASIASASLANDCVSQAPKFAAGDCADGVTNCGFCQQSTMQIALAAGNGTQSVAIEVVAVRILDAKTGKALQTLPSRQPTQWDQAAGAYVEWNESIAPNAAFTAGYELGAPDWQTIGGGEAWATYEMQFQIEVDLRVNGQLRTIQSAALSREPEVVT